ncbi:MAG TPA: branched-chain amino acid ABC transporter permease [Acidimicrobiales bacterium]
MHYGNLYHQFWSLTFDGVNIGAIYALFALGYTLVYGVLRLINFAHSEVFMIGTFGALFATEWMGIPAGGAVHHGFTVVLILVGAGLVAMAFSGGAAVLLERIAYRPLRRRGSSRLAALISAIGASLFLQQLFFVWRGANYDQFPRIMVKAHWGHVLGADIRSDKVIIIATAVVMMVALDRFVNLTRLGRGIRAVAQDAETAALMGVDIDRVITTTFLVGGLMAGVAALLFMIYNENTYYLVGFTPGIKAFTAAVLGGIGNLRGALLGGLLLGVIENYGGALFGGQWKDVTSFVVLVVVLMFRPTGLLGERLGRARV